LYYKIFQLINDLNFFSLFIASVNGSESSKKQEKSLNCDNNIPNISPLFPSSSRLSESSSDSDSNSESSSDSDSSDNDED
jgi:hypothetical protein